MALKKLKEFDNGLSGEYWIASTLSDKHENKTSVIMVLYKDQATREAGKKFIERKNVGVMDGCYLSGSEVYAWVKRSIMSTPSDSEIEPSEPVETNWFANAEDC